MGRYIELVATAISNVRYKKQYWNVPLPHSGSPDADGPGLWRCVISWMETSPVCGHQTLWRVTSVTRDVTWRWGPASASPRPSPSSSSTPPPASSSGSGPAARMTKCERRKLLCLMSVYLNHALSNAKRYQIYSREMQDALFISINI